MERAAESQLGELTCPTQNLTCVDSRTFNREAMNLTIRSL